MPQDFSIKGHFKHKGIGRIDSFIFDIFKGRREDKYPQKADFSGLNVRTEQRWSVSHFDSETTAHR